MVTLRGVKQSRLVNVGPHGVLTCFEFKFPSTGVRKAFNQKNKDFLVL